METPSKASSSRIQDEGYAANLGLTLESAKQMIDALEETRWINIYTRAVFVEFNVFNPGSSLANMGIVLFEFSTDGNIVPSQRMDTVQLYRYTGGNGVVALLSEILCAIFVNVIMVFELRKVCRERRKYFSSFWNWSQLIALMFFSISVGLYTVRCLWTMWVVEDIMNNPGKLVSFKPIIRWNNVYLVLMSFVAFLTQCQLLHLLRYNQTIAILGSTLSRSATTLLSFGFISFVVFTAFTIGTYLMFFQIQPYSTYFIAMQSQLEAFLGKFNFGQLVSMYGRPAGLFLLVYLLTMIVFIMNIFVAIMNGYLKEVENNRSLQPKDYQVVDHFLNTLKSFFTPGQPAKKRAADGIIFKNGETKNVQDLSKRIGYLDSVVNAMIRDAMTLEKSDALLFKTVLKK